MTKCQYFSLTYPLLDAQEELGKFREGPDEVEIFFSAHGVPLSYVEEAGDPYKVPTSEHTVAARCRVVRSMRFSVEVVEWKFVECHATGAGHSPDPFCAVQTQLLHQ